ncbi:MAG: hypothetical protein EP330_13485 [Deltaproteobacteria bacterium]|nr:MAG: hypothetical protein EP330_13485 [Deltaproteobacteria bacterium]
MFAAAVLGLGVGGLASVALAPTPAPAPSAAAQGSVPADVACVERNPEVRALTLELAAARSRVEQFAGRERAWDQPPPWSDIAVMDQLLSGTGLQLIDLDCVEEPCIVEVQRSVDFVPDDLRDEAGPITELLAGTELGDEVGMTWVTEVLREDGDIAIRARVLVGESGDPRRVAYRLGELGSFTEAGGAL